VQANLGGGSQRNLQVTSEVTNPTHGLEMKQMGKGSDKHEVSSVGSFSFGRGNPEAPGAGLAPQVSKVPAEFTAVASNQPRFHQSVAHQGPGHNGPTLGTVGGGGTSAPSFAAGSGEDLGRI
jgi:hypothetical protein